MYKIETITGTDVADTDALFTISKVREWCYVVGSDYDTLLTGLVSAAREYAEGRTWRQIIPATYTLYLDRFPKNEGVIEIDKCPCISVESIKYYDADDVLQTWASTNYQVDLNSEPGRIKPVDGIAYPNTDERLNAVEIAFTAGYDASSQFYTMPEKLATAIRLLVHHWFNNRVEVEVNDGRSVDAKQIPVGAEFLLEQISLRGFV